VGDLLNWYMALPFVQENNPRPIITDEQYALVLEHAPADFRDFIICGWETGMRSGEICNLTPGQVFLDVTNKDGEKADFIYLGIFDTKTKAERIVPISPVLKKLLKKK